MRPSLLIRINAWQGALMLVTLTSNLGSTSLNRLLSLVSGRDMWLSGVIATPPALLAVYVITLLAERCPGDGLAAILQRTLGFAGRLLTFLYPALFLLQVGLMLREFSSLSVMLLPASPPEAFALPLVALAFYSGRLGIEVMARVNAIILIGIDLPLGVLLSLFVKKDQHLDLLLPIAAQGLDPILSGAAILLGLFGSSVLLLVLAPLTSSSPRSFRRANILGALMSAGIILGHSAGPFLMFGDATLHFIWPSFAQIGAIHFGRFIERLDVLAIILWTHGFWISCSLFLYAAARVSARSLSRSSEQPFLLPCALLALAIYAVVGRNQNESIAMRADVASALLILGVLVPMLALAALLIGTRLRKARSSAGAG